MLVFQLKVQNNACLKKWTVRTLVAHALVKFVKKPALTNILPVFQSLENLNVTKTGENAQLIVCRVLHTIKIVSTTVLTNIMLLSKYMDRLLLSREELIVLQNVGHALTKFAKTSAYPNTTPVLQF